MHTKGEKYDMDEQAQLLVIAGASGSLTGAALHKQGGWLDIVIETFVGVTFTFFMSPAICEYYKIESEHYRAAICYIDGAIGFYVMLTVITWVMNNDIIGRILARLGRKLP